MNTIEQHHSGSGDNVRDKIYVEIKALAPADLVGSMELVFESIRKRDRTTARIQMAVLKETARHNPEAAALLEAVFIYGDLLEAEDHGLAWTTVSKIAASTQNALVKDVCLAALLRLSHNTERATAAKDYFLNEEAPGLYSKEAFLRYYADQAELETASKKFLLAEGELTGIVEGALRLRLTDLATCMALRLNTEHKSYNSAVLAAFASAYELNDDLALRHLWVSTPDVRGRLDCIADQVAELLDLSKGLDLRLYNMACPIFEAYAGEAPPALFAALKKYNRHLGPSHSATGAKIRALSGDRSDLPAQHQELWSARRNPKLRMEWCRNFLAAGNHTWEQVIPFIYLATPAEIDEWLANGTVLDASELEGDFVKLFASTFRSAGLGSEPRQRHQLAEVVAGFLRKWGERIVDLAPERVLELADKLCEAGLSHMALSFTSPHIPDLALWTSPFVLGHLRCLLESQQYKSFDKVVSRVAGAEDSLQLMNLQSIKAERMGDIRSALVLSDQMIALMPEASYSWYRGCYLRDRFGTEAEQSEFQARIPDSALQNYSRDALAILVFLTKSGDFKRAEGCWVAWFIEDPRGRAVDLVNFHFGLSVHEVALVEPSLHVEQCVAAIQFEMDGNSLIKLIVDDHQGSGEFTLKVSSQLAALLRDLPLGESGSLGMVSYKVVERLPPYLACVRIALQLRHLQNDGSDTFALLKVPENPDELVSFLEERLGRDADHNKSLFKDGDIPLYMWGHRLFPNNAFKGALNCWGDPDIPKAMLWSRGEDAPSSVVLDAYGISYLAVTDLARPLLESGVALVLPTATKEALGRWVEEMADEKLMLIGINDAGRLFRTTAADIRARESHTLDALRLILASASTAYPIVHDASVEVYSIRDAVDTTIYDAMQLSAANSLPWLCFDEKFASLHQSYGCLTANAYALVARASAIAPFDFEHKRHGLLRYALGMLPLPVTGDDLLHLAKSPNDLASYILWKIIQGQGEIIFATLDKVQFLLDLIFVHLISRFRSGWNPRMSEGVSGFYTEHIFNHGLRRMLAATRGGTAEARLAASMLYLASREAPLAVTEFIVNGFLAFAEGHFLHAKAIHSNLRVLMEPTQS